MKPERLVRYPCVLRVRVTSSTRDAIDRAARGAKRGKFARHLLEKSIGEVTVAPQSRPVQLVVRCEEDLANAVRYLGSVAGNLQRSYTLLAEGRGVVDADLLALKSEIRAAAAQVRAAIGEVSDP